MGHTVLSPSEATSCSVVAKKLETLKSVLERNSLCDPIDPRLWLEHLTNIKDALGNIGNSMSFLASLLIKEYLTNEFAVADFDAGLKPQGAPGADIEATAGDGRTIIGELKTTKPYQPGFGAAQRDGMLKDLRRLAACGADIRIMFVTDKDAYDALRLRECFFSVAPNILLVDLVTPRQCVLGKG